MPLVHIHNIIQCIGNMTQHNAINVHYDNVEVDKYKEAQNDETSEPYYLEIIHNDNSDSGYNVIMKPNISYSSIQMAATTNSMEVNQLCVPYVILQSNHMHMMTSQSPDYENIH